MITTIRLPLANAYLLHGARPILVDTGAAGDEGRVLAAMENAGVRPADLALILLTHGHADHAGSAAALRQATGAPIALHRADSAMAARGHNDPMTPLGLEARLVQLMVSARFPPLEADLLFATPDELAPTLAELGISGRILHTPGHTPGSVTLLLGDGAALAGDLLRGGRLGGRLAGGHPMLPYFADDLAANQVSVAHLLAHSPSRLYVGHGGPLDAGAVANRFGPALNN